MHHLQNKTAISVGLSLSIILILLMAYCLRGWLRTTVVPGFVSHRYSKQIQSVTDDELRKVNKSLKMVGLELKREKPAECMLDIARRIHTSVWCGVEAEAYNGDADLFIQEKMIAVKEQLSDQGWRGGSEDLWEGSEQSEINYSFSKSIDNLQCDVRYGLDDSVLTGRMLCSQTEVFMGDPYKHL